MHVYHYYLSHLLGYQIVYSISIIYYTPVQASLWTGGSIWLHALAINLYLIRYLHLSFIYTTGGFLKKYSDIKESDNDPTIIQPGV